MKLMAAVAFRPPAVPVVSVDPFFSVWSAADRLTDRDTTHWTGAKQPINILAELDGKLWRLCGTSPADIPALPQVATEVRPFTTVCTFLEGGRKLSLEFLAAKFTDELDVFSRPVTYVMVQTEGWGEVKLLPSISPALATNDDRAEMVTNTCSIFGAPAVSIGRKEQKPLGASGDRVRCDWGYAWLVKCSDTRFMLAYDDVETIEYGIRAMEDFYRSIGMPTNMRELGIAPTEEQIVAMAKSCEIKTGGANGAIIPLTADDMVKIYKMAL